MSHAWQRLVHVPPRIRAGIGVCVLAGLGLALVRGSALAQDAPGGPAGPFRGEHCAVECGRFVPQSCEVWDAGGAPDCRCQATETAGAAPHCTCSDGSTPSDCTCSRDRNLACDPDDPPEGCGSCRCQC